MTVRYTGSLVPASQTAPLLLGVVSTALSGLTIGPWTFFTEVDGPDVVCVYATCDIGGGYLRVFAVGGWAGTTVPGVASIDTAGTAQRCWVLSGKILAADFAWAGFASAAPLGVGGQAIAYGMVTAGVTSTIRIGLWIGNRAIGVRTEGSTPGSSARVALVGGLCQPLGATETSAPLTPDPDGLLTGIWTTGYNGGLSSTWFTSATALGVYGFHSAVAGAAHGALLIGGVWTTSTTRGAQPTVTTNSIDNGSEITPVPHGWYDFATGQLRGYDASLCGSNQYNGVTEIESGGVGLCGVIPYDLTSLSQCLVFAFAGVNVLP